MMRVVFYDKERVTYTAIGNVIQINQGIKTIKGRVNKGYWLVPGYEELEEVFMPSSKYQLYRVEM